MAKPELGVKRVCGSCGSKFYDLAKSPIVCPKCGTVYQVAAVTRARPEPVAPKPVPVEEPEVKRPANVISLEDADAEATGKKKTAATPDADDDETETPAATEDDTFLEQEEEEPGTVSDIIGEKVEGDEEP